MRTRRALRGLRALPLLVAAVLALAVAAPGQAAPPRVTVLGDSVQASFGFAPQAVRHLGRGLRLRVEASVCRRLTSPGCLGGSPPSALALASSLGPSLGDAVVINVGYNDDTSSYDVPAMLATLRRAGVRAVVWVTLREQRAPFGAVNARIRAAARGPDRGMVVRIADWNAYSAGRPWFAGDGLHLNATGALGLATLLRERVLDALADAGVAVPGRPATVRGRFVRTPGFRATRVAGDGGALWLAGAGGRLARLRDRTGRPLAPVAPAPPGARLISDGRGAWLRDPASGDLTDPGTRALVAAGAAGPLVARAGGVLWLAGGDGPLEGVRLADGFRSDVAPSPAGRVRAAAADARALWLLVVGPGASRDVRLERRDPATGMLVRSTPLARGAATATVAAGDGSAWVLARSGQLLRVGRDGRVRKVRGRIRAIAPDGADVWAVTGPRTVLRLDRTGRLVGRAVAGRSLTARIATTDDHVWVLAVGGRHVLRIPRG